VILPVACPRCEREKAAGAGNIPPVRSSYCHGLRGLRAGKSRLSREGLTGGWEESADHGRHDGCPHRRTLLFIGGVENKPTDPPATAREKRLILFLLDFRMIW
jgi:hypothetical protein